MKLVKSFALIFFITVLIMSFQNCTIRQNTGLLGSKTAAQTESEKVVINAPFAYDVVVDTISYNSCVGENLNKLNIHGLKVGVNEGFTDTTAAGSVKAGAKLRSDFLEYIGKSVPPSFPSTVITPAQIQYVLSNSPKNVDSFIQYAVRKKTDLSVVVDRIQTPVNAAPILDRDGFVEREPLKSDNVIQQITKNVIFGPNGTVLSEGSRVYNLYSKSSPQPMEASFGFSSSVDETFSAQTNVDDGTGAGEQYSDIVRKKFNSASTDKIILAVTYGNPLGTNGAAVNDAGLNSPKRADPLDKTKAFGRGYELKFEPGSAKAGWRENKLTRITDSIGLGDWTCENFVIMKKSHWNNPKPDEAGCAPLSSADFQNTIFIAQIKRLRRHYSDADWNIGVYYGKYASYVPPRRDLQTLCLVPKQNECYLPTANITTDAADVGVQYNPGEECYLSRFQLMGVNYTGGLTGDAARKLGRCPQFASICIRSSSNY
jgi:hypothetical protein